MREHLARFASKQAMRGGGIDGSRTALPACVGSARNSRAAADQIVDDNRRFPSNISCESFAGENIIATIFLEKGAANGDGKNSAEGFPKFFGTLNAAGIG